MNFADVVGLFGVIAYLGAYGLMQMRVLTLEDGRYALLNVVGGLALIYSLCWNFNLWSFISQVMWASSPRSGANAISPPCSA